MAAPHARAIAHLSAADPVLGKWIARVGRCGWRRENDGTHFDHIARSIVYQQLSGKAAATIHGRCGSLDAGAQSPKRVARTPDFISRAICHFALSLPTNN